MIELNMAKFNVKNPQTGEYEPLDGASQAKVQSNWNQTDNSAEDFIKNKPALYTKTQTDALLDEKVDKETGKGLSTNDYTTEEKNKLAGIASGAEVNIQSDWSQSDSSADDYIKNKPTIPTVNDATLTIQKNGTAVGTFSANAATAATINVTVPVDADDVSALPDTTKYGASLSLSIDSSTYVVTASLKDQDGNTLGTVQTIDLPLETVVVGGSYDDTTKKVILTLKNGTTVDFSVADLVAGLQTEITSTNKLDADLVDDTTSVHKFVTAADKTAWNAKSDFSGSYNDLTDKPTIPAAQVNADWNATSGAAQILNKPTIYTKTEIDAVLAEKLNTADVDEDISSISMNPVQNRVIQAPLARLVDAGAKNLLKITATSQTVNGVTFTVNDDETITADGTAIDGDAKFIVSDQNFENLVQARTFLFGSGCPTGGSDTTYFITFTYLSKDFGDGTGYRQYPFNTSNTNVFIIVRKGCTVNNLIFKPMLCKAEDHKISPEFVPYAKSNYELTKDVRPIPSLVDKGAKNLLNLGTGEINPAVTTHGVTWTKETLTGAVVANGTSDSNGSYPVISKITLKPGTYFMRGGTQRIKLYEANSGTTDSGNGASFTVTNNTEQPIQILVIAAANTTFNNESIYPMVCSSEDYAASPTFQPYAFPNTTITPALIKQVNEGAKNLVINFGKIEHNGCIFTYGSDGRITVTGTKSTALAMAEFISDKSLSNYGLSAGDKIVAISDNENVGLEIIFADDQGTVDPSISVYNEIRTIIIPSGRTKWYLRLQIKPSIRGTINESTKPMVCDKKLYDIDPTVTPYAKSNYELTRDTRLIPSLVDRGAKNHINYTLTTLKNINTSGTWNGNIYSINNVTYTVNDDMTITASGTATGNTSLILKRFDPQELIGYAGYILLGCPTGGSDETYRLEIQRAGSPWTRYVINYGEGVQIPDVGDSFAYQTQCFLTLSNGATVSNLTFKPMICSMEDYEASPEFVPYAPTNRELYEMQANSMKLVYSNFPGEISKTLTYQMTTTDFSNIGNAHYCGVYLIAVVNWSTTPSVSIYSACYSGGTLEYHTLTKIGGEDAQLTIDENAVITYTGKGKIQIYALR